MLQKKHGENKIPAAQEVQWAHKTLLFLFASAQTHLKLELNHITSGDRRSLEDWSPSAQELGDLAALLHSLGIWSRWPQGPKMPLLPLTFE
jgi:hypothetical protein